MFTVKICGVTTVHDALTAIAAGADAIGLNFFSRSPRYIDESRAREIAEALPDGVWVVGVFVGASPDEMRDVARRVPLDALQVHEAASLEFVPNASDPPVIRAYATVDNVLTRIAAELDELPRHAAPPPMAILLDAHVRGQFGGTGTTANWSLARQVREAVGGVPLVLAGGLRPDNVAEAIRQVRPSAVDVASGVESRPGAKDPAKMRALVAAAQAAFTS